MTQLKNIEVTLPAADLQQAAGFYSEVLGLRIVSESSHRIALAHGDLRLSLMKADPGFTPDTHSIHLRFTVATPQHVDEIAARVKKANRPLLEEVRLQPDGTCTMTCLGPDDHLIEVTAAPPSPQPATAPSSHESTEPFVSSASRPTRADRYMLEAQVRLAKIKEELAGLSTAVSQSDIAATLEEMKEKVMRRVNEFADQVAEQIEPPTPDPQSTLEAERQQQQQAEAEREMRRKEIEATLARYKAEINNQYEEAAQPEEAEKQDDPSSSGKTLGPSDDDPASGT